jgi:hypothetical protein
VVTVLSSSQDHTGLSLGTEKKKNNTMTADHSEFSHIKECKQGTTNKTQIYQPLKNNKLHLQYDSYKHLHFHHPSPVNLSWMGMKTDFWNPG